MQVAAGGENADGRVADPATGQPPRVYPWTIPAPYHAVVATTEADAGRASRAAIGVLAALAGATALVAALEAGLRLDNASSVYLVAVAVVAIRWGTLPAIITALGAFLVYNLLFVEPRNTFAVASPEELLNLLLLLFVGVVIGRLAGSQRDRERVAQRREREARAQFAITRELATAPRLPQAMQAVVERIGRETWFRRIWIGLGATVAQERVAADTEPRPADAGDRHARRAPAGPRGRRRSLDPDQSEPRCAGGGGRPLSRRAASRRRVVGIALGPPGPRRRQSSA